MRANRLLERFSWAPNVVLSFCSTKNSIDQRSNRNSLMNQHRSNSNFSCDYIPEGLCKNILCILHYSIHSSSKEEHQEIICKQKGFLILDFVGDNMEFPFFSLKNQLSISTRKSSLKMQVNFYSRAADTPFFNSQAFQPLVV